MSHIRPNYVLKVFNLIWLTIKSNKRSNKFTLTFTTNKTDVYLILQTYVVSVCKLCKGDVTTGAGGPGKRMKLEEK